MVILPGPVKLDFIFEEHTTTSRPRARSRAILRRSKPPLLGLGVWLLGKRVKGQRKRCDRGNGLADLVHRLSNPDPALLDVLLRGRSAESS
jgi:hypothetical protein